MACRSGDRPVRLGVSANVGASRRLNDALNAEPITTLVRGIRGYRLGAYDDAVILLRSAEFNGHESAALLSYLAVALHHASDRDGAAVGVERLCSVRSSKPNWWTKAQDRLLHEVETVVGRSHDEG
jgi:hypothetical protein